MTLSFAVIERYPKMQISQGPCPIETKPPAITI